ncbi:hypothetical protein C8F01DRAFT_1263257 [Mycena amicta]|nr:hypothetical protein C8F01DRAFT_1263257 [Mycena amicta]
MAALQSVHALSKSQLLNGETFPIFPTGCTVDPGHISSVLDPCCLSVGSTPTQDIADGTSGCPYNSVFLPTANQSFGTCALERGAESVSCAPAPNSTRKNVNEAKRHGLRSMILALVLVLTIGLAQ